jgi:hypothetical protein
LVIQCRREIGPIKWDAAMKEQSGLNLDSLFADAESFVSSSAMASGTINAQVRSPINVELGDLSRAEMGFDFLRYSCRRRYFRVHQNFRGRRLDSKVLVYRRSNCLRHICVFGGQGGRGPVLGRIRLLRTVVLSAPARGDEAFGRFIAVPDAYCSNNLT